MSERRAVISVVGSYSLEPYIKLMLLFTCR